MQTRFNLFENPVSATFMKRFAGAGLMIHQSSLPRTVQELVSLRASQINGCGWCIDMHTKEAAAAGESAVRLNLVGGPGSAWNAPRHRARSGYRRCIDAWRRKQKLRARCPRRIVPVPR